MEDLLAEEARRYSMLADEGSANERERACKRNGVVLEVREGFTPVPEDAEVAEVAATEVRRMRLRWPRRFF